MKPEQFARNQIDQLLDGTGWKIRNIEEYDPSESSHIFNPLFINYSLATKVAFIIP
jgi:hypothetical protein